MRAIYSQHREAFAFVSAYVVMHDGRRVATIAIRHPLRGERVWAYVHWLGDDMARGKADGYGYAKESRALQAAADKFGEMVGQDSRSAFYRALGDDVGTGWAAHLERAGFTVLQAV